MRTIVSVAGQTVFDVAVQEMGSPEGVWDILELNPLLRMDILIPVGTTVYLPDTVIKPAMVDYYDRNELKPVSDSGAEVVYIEKNADIIQLVDYGVSGGTAYFNGIGSFLLNPIKSVIVEYSLDQDYGTPIPCWLEKSTDGSTWSKIDGTDAVLALEDSLYTYELTDVEATFIRFCIETESVEVPGVISKITYKS
jgi:hypothetical protein